MAAVAIAAVQGLTAARVPKAKSTAGQETVADAVTGGEVEAKLSSGNEELTTTNEMLRKLLALAEAQAQVLPLQTGSDSATNSDGAWKITRRTRVKVRREA